MAIHNKNIIVDNLLLRYYFFNPKGAKKTILFLHGWGIDGTSFAGLVDRLAAKKYAVCMLDLPGFGQSQVPKTEYNLDDYARIVSGFVKKIGLKKINLVGHSFGGRITIKLAAADQDFIQKIVLVDAAGINSPSPSKKLTLIIAKIIKPLFAPEFMQPLRKRLYVLIGSEYLDNFQLSKIFSRVVSENLTPLLPKIKKPTLIVWGGRDKTTPLYYARLMKKLIKNSRLTIFEKAGHFSFIDEPTKFIEALTEFV